MPHRSPLSLTLPKVTLVAALAALALLTAGARPAAASTPCWKALLNDWYDGRIDNTYPLHCYTDALRHLPSDVRTYSNAADDIERALQSARARLRSDHKGSLGPNTLIPPQKSGGSGPGGKGGAGTTTPRPTTSPGRQKPGGIASQVSSSSPSSVPVPLLVLGGLALLLVAAGAAGLVAKRYQRRHPRR